MFGYLTYGVVTDDTTFAEVRAVRIQVFTAEYGRTISDELDGNDFAATHFYAKSGSRIVGAARLRSFGPTVLLERLCLLKEYRSWPNLRGFVDFLSRYAAYCGHTQLTGGAYPRVDQLWRKLGAELTDESGQYGGHPGRKIILHLRYSAGITVHTDLATLSTRAGEWPDFVHSKIAAE